jgi:predicted TIM-barrel fold metal-dependent hydrolase
VGIDDFFDLAPRLRALGWHPEVWAACADLVKVLPAMTATDMPVVVDHLAGIDVAPGIGDGDFRRLLALLREGRVWVKLTLCRNSRDFPDYRDERPFHDAIVEANPDRLVWGSDWPFVRMDDTAPDAGHLVDLFDQWTGGDATLRSKVFVDNPEALYRG